MNITKPADLPDTNCRYYNQFGFCRKYSDLEVDVPCPNNGECEDYVEENNDG